ncbi:MAG: hypothetical protein M3Q81_04130, partial [bacterium]|nr:hypothetical protein [bacterium]
MKYASFLILLLLSLIMLAEKAFFLFLEPLQRVSLYGTMELLLLILLVLYGSWSFLKVGRTTTNQDVIAPFRLTRTSVGLILLSLCVVGSSLVHTMYKKSLDWDAIALYDARAQFLEADTSFSQMTELTKYDSKNGYYYLLYPPFTSITHYLWNQLDTSISVSVLYTLSLAALGLTVFLLLTPRLGYNWSLVATLLTISSESLFNTSLVAYTNLPYTLYLGIGVLVLHKYLIERQTWALCFGAILVAGSQWIRFLEPSWIPVIVAFSIAAYLHLGFKKSYKAVIVLAVINLLAYFSWKYFSDVIANKEVIFSTTPLRFLEPIVGIFTGSFLIIGLAYLRMWGKEIIIYIGACLPLFLLQKNREWKPDLFLQLLIIISFLMYFAGL